MSGKHHNSQIRAPDAAGIAAAVNTLQGGQLVALPTETVYGLAARADCAEAVAAIYRAKGRPDFNPLIVHVGTIEHAATIARLDDRVRGLADAFWPGPLTLVLPLQKEAPISPAVTAGLSTVAIRCPSHPVMRRVLLDSALALAAPSANRSGAVSPTHAAHVAASLGDKVSLILDGGACAAGIESTIVALREGGGWQILRPGPIAVAQIAAILGEDEQEAASAGIEAPGQLASHYSPGKPIRLNAINAASDEFFIGFGPVAGMVNLSTGGDLAEAASRLYACLHRAAAAIEPRIAVAPIPERGIGAAIKDRLRRAAA
ncbi:L-threonylcarbamoyladenylate synthase [Novosphingobium sp.]|uniref:L-threonylcarbamoyladenylate synthase n=1 Tax=Novosphingobium sp. TaxID=1874826 RepID=UPI0025E0E649|nr:L-threonylcarbamoyladenylate synthase [Novosphingobium sp.]